MLDSIDICTQNKTTTIIVSIMDCNRVMITKGDLQNECRKLPLIKAFSKNLEYENNKIASLQL